MPEPTLLQYLCTRFAHVNENLLLQHHELETHHEQFHKFLTQTHVVTNEGKNPGAILRGEMLESAYPEFIDSLVARKSDPQNQGQTDFKTNFLKSTDCEMLCARIGRKSFAESLQEIQCLIRPQGNVALSDVARARRKLQTCELARKFHMYFRKSPVQKIRFLLPQDAETTVRQIFKIRDNQRHIPKKYRQLIGVLKVAQHNDSKLHYPQLLANLVPPRELETSLFANAVPFSQVTRFVFTVVHRLIPNEIFGCQENWNLVNQNIYEMLHSERTEAINTRNLVAKLKITAISWLGKSPRPTSKQDFLSRVKTLHDFVHWFYSRFVAKLVACFWYVTDNPMKNKAGDPCNSYFLHSTWNQLSRLWLKEYAQKYLHPETGNVSGTVAKFNYGVLRLVPKKSDFRPLCIPLKTSNHGGEQPKVIAAQKKQHLVYDYNVMRPIRDIIRNQQQRVFRLSPGPFPRCNSVNDVGHNIACFKSELKQQYGQLPVLYGVQFDMKHCYDNLNQAKILYCIEELFHADDVAEEYIVRKYAHQPKANGKHATPKSLIKTRANVEETDVFTYAPENTTNVVCGDRLRTLKFTRGNVLDLVRSQVLDATTELPNSAANAYKRTRGVFQGLPLSGTLCDIVYNSLVDNVLAQVRSEIHTCILLRLADDFLFISTSSDACENMLRRARSREAKEYGAHVNSEKVSWIDASQEEKHCAQFLGLSIDFRTLSLQRPENEVVALSSNVRRSLKASLAYLDWRFRLRVSEYLLDLTLSNFKTVSQNACQLYGPTLKRAALSAKEYKQDPDAADRLAVFALEQIVTTISKFKAVNGSSELVHDLYRDLWQVLNAHLTKHGFETSEIDHLVNRI